MLIGNYRKFTITTAHRQKAKRLGVSIDYSSNPAKKLDVFKNGKKVASIGARGYMDYQLYKRAEQSGQYPKGYANKRRKLYRIRHKDENKAGTPGYYALNILW